MSTAPADASTFPPAGLERRFYAFTLDRLIAWTLEAVVVVAAAHFLVGPGHPWVVVGLVVAAVVVVGLGFGLLLGLRGTSPGKAALGLRVVRPGTGLPIGAGPALLRTLVLGASTLPTFGLGVATLAWTAVMDRGRQRRGWHDHVADSVVVDVRPVPVEPEEVVEAPRQIVNLTAMRLVPAPRTEPVSAPARSPRPAPARIPAEPRLPAQPPTEPVTEQPDTEPVTEQPVTEPVGTPPPARRRSLGAPLVDPPLTPGDPPAAPGTPPAATAPTAPTAPTGPPPAAPPASAPTPAAGPATVERTAMSSPEGRRRLARWRVSFDSGESFLVEGLALIGRRPEPRAGEPVRHLVPLRSEDMSLSKTHAQFQVAPDGVLVVMDRGSTNGSILIRQGVGRELPAGRPATLLDGDRIRFGDREMTVAREG